MLDGRILDIIERVAMSFKGNGSDAFGGVQVRYNCVSLCIY